jgi:hypothetical protein
VRHLASFLDRTIPCQEPSKIFELEDGDFLQWGRRARFSGLLLGDDVLVLDYRTFSSFRVKIANLPALRSAIRCYRPKVELYDRSYRSAYFAANQDNPYALWNMLLATRMNPRPDDLTQFPPLFYPKDSAKQRAGVDEMRERSRPGDLFFTFDRNSGLSRLVRAWDRGMWSHCGMVGQGGTLYEMTTSGAVAGDFSRLYCSSLDVGLYRIREAISDYDPEVAIDFVKRCVAARAPYGWYQLVRKALRRKLGIPFKGGPDDVTPAGLLYSNNFMLICFA